MFMDGQVRELRRLLNLGKSLAASARMTDMSEKTARTYRDDDRLPSERKVSREYRTRVDPFADVWPEVQQRLEAEPRLKAKTLFSWIQQQFPGKFPDSTRRTFERRIALWRCTKGPGKTVFFPQDHHPGTLAASDFTVMNELRITIAGSRFDHSLYHCVLTYSNTESISLCFSESFEALSQGIQKAFWEFGGVPQRHRSDSLAAAVRNHSDQKTFTARYSALMDHYRCEPERTNARCANENGDVESLNGHLKDRVDQALLLRGSRDFASRTEYIHFVEGIIADANSNRAEKLAEEQQELNGLPDHRLDTDEMLGGLSVSKSCTIQVRKNTYSVPSRLIGKKVDVKISAELLTVTHRGIPIQTMARLSGKGGASINYRHVIDSLLRKPGAFEDYRYREEMFPTSHFRMAYDLLHAAHTARVADKMYLAILGLAAYESQDAVQDALRQRIQSGESIDIDVIRSLVEVASESPPVVDVKVDPPKLSDYDSLLTHPDMESPCDETYSEGTEQEVGSQFANEETSNTRDEKEQPCAPGEGSSRAVQESSSANIPGTLSGVGRSGSGRESQSCGVPIGTDIVGVRGTSGGEDQETDGAVASSAQQDMGDVRLSSSPTSGSASTRESSRGLVPGSSREHSNIWETRFGEESRSVRTGAQIDRTRTADVVHKLCVVGSGIVDCQTRPTAPETDQATLSLRRSFDRRPGLCTTESGGDGSTVHALGRTLRAGQRSSDEQSSIQ